MKRDWKTFIRPEYRVIVDAEKKGDAARKAKDYRKAAAHYEKAAKLSVGEANQKRFRKLVMQMNKAAANEAVDRSPGAMSVVEEIRNEGYANKGKKVNVRRLKVGDTILLPVFPEGRRKMILFKVTGVGPHAAGGVSVKASSVKPGLTDTSRVFSATDHVTRVKGMEESVQLVEEIQEAYFKSRYGSSRDDDMVLLTQSGKVLPMKYIPGDSNYVYTKTKHKRYKRIAHAKQISSPVAMKKFQDWLQLDDD